ncbi:MAG TPA: VOC family protein [Solirubrobacteraceae bacterium]|jgi:catechol 2,3-dioxygenase-like lactoylglutathione lyase family enzyme
MALWNGKLTQVVLTAPDPAAAIADWAPLLGGEAAPDAVHLGDDTRISVIEGDRCGLVEARFLAGPALVAAAQQLGAQDDGTTMTLRDPDGWVVRFEPTDDVRPMKLEAATLSHCTLMSPTPGEQRAHYERVGFLLSDAMGEMFFWLRPNPVHHSLAFVAGPAVGINHLAVELPDAAAFIAAIDAVVAHGGKLEFGPGRHLFGNNLFAYFRDEHGLRWELCAELERRDPLVPPGLHPAEARKRSVNLFGPAPPQSFLQEAGGPGPQPAMRPV